MEPCAPWYDSYFNNRINEQKQDNGTHTFFVENL